MNGLIVRVRQQFQNLRFNNFNTMVTEELIAYIKRQQANHVPEESIRAILLSNGWLKVDVDKAFDSLFKVQESQVVTSKDLKSKIASFTPDFKKPNTSIDLGIQTSQTPVSNSQSLLKDSYREQIDSSPKEQFTSQGLGTSLGKGLPDDIKDRLRKISSESIFAPQKEIINPVTSSQSDGSNPLLSQLPQSTPTFQERLMSEPQASQFPIKRETVMAQPMSSLHMIEDKPLSPPPADKNRLYSNFKGGSPYSPSMDKFNNPMISTPQRKSPLGKIFFILFFVGILVGGYYLYSQKPDLVRSIIDKIVSQTTSNKELVSIEDTTTPEKEIPEVNEVTPKTPEKEITTPQTSSLPTAETTLKAIALKIPGYVGAKSTTKGVCANISSGIAKDILALRQSYGQSVSCIDDVSGFSVSVPYQTTGEFMCIDTSQDVVLIKALPKSSRCI